MLQSIRDKSQGWIAWTIIIVLCLAFVVWGFSSYFHLGQSDVVATVNGHEVSREQLNQQYQHLQRNQQATLEEGDNSASSDRKLWQQALNTLLLEQVMYQQLTKLGLMASDVQINAVIAQIPAFQQEGQFSQQRFLNALSVQGISPAAFLQQIKTQFVNQQLRATFEDSTFILPNELDEFIGLGLQTRDIHYATISAKQFAKKIKVNDADIAQYYQQHQENFSVPERVRIAYITLSIDKLAKPIQLTNHDLEEYYQTHREQYTTSPTWHVAHILLSVPADANEQATQQVKQQADQIVSQLRQGANFTKLAKRYSQDGLTANKGGVLVGYALGVLGAKFDAAVSGLKPGKVADPIKTQYGYEIIKLLSVKPAVVQPFAKVKARIKTLLTQQKAETLFANDSELLASITYENPDSLTKASQQLNLPIQQSDTFTRAGAKTGIAANKRVVNAAFSNDVLINSNNSDVIALDAKSVIVLRVIKHTPKQVRPLADVHQSIKQTLIKQSSAARAQAIGKPMLTKLGNGVKTTELTNMHVAWKAASINRNSQKVTPAIADYAFTLPPPTSQQPSYGGITLPSGDYVLVRVNAVHPGKLTKKIEKDAMARLRYQQQLMQMMASYDYEQFLANLLKESKIKIKDKQFNDQLITTIANGS